MEKLAPLKNPISSVLTTIAGYSQTVVPLLASHSLKKHINVFHNYRVLAQPLRVHAARLESPVSYSVVYEIRVVLCEL